VTARSGCGLLRARPGALTLAVLLTLTASGCGLLLDFDSYPRGTEIECFVTVVNPDGVEVDLSSRTHPDFVEGIPHFTGGGGFGGGGGGGAVRPIRPFFTCPDCAASCAVADTTEAEAQWRRWINQRIDEVASGPASDSPFSVHPGPWCVKEIDGGPSTLRCELRETLTSVPSCGPALTAGPLGSCPGAPPTGACLEVACDGTAPCREIVFPPREVGSSAASLVTVRNCGAPDDSPVTISVDDRIMPIGPRADFAVPDVTNACLPRTPEEMRDGRVLALPSVAFPESSCTFEVTFTPRTAGIHEAEKVFATSTVPAYRIRLEGDAPGGTLVSDTPEPVCLNNPAVDGCSETRSLRITNSGPGSVTVDAVMFEALASANFRILRPPPPTLPATLPAGASVDVTVQWCPDGSGTAGIREGYLYVDSNADPPLMPIKFQFQSLPCPPSP
jgi:hypothetical protein